MDLPLVQVKADPFVARHQDLKGFGARLPDLVRSAITHP
jgi:hypothetical protein